jgi:hypothetical protein
MPVSRENRAPSQRRIGCRIRVKQQHADEAAALFDRNGFVPIYVEHREDGDVSFWFGKEPDDVLHRIVTSVPLEFFALRAVVGNIV